MVPTIKLPACTSVCTVKSVVIGIVYSWVVATGDTSPLHACFPELLSNIRDAIIMIRTTPCRYGTVSFYFEYAVASTNNIQVP